MKPQSIEKNLRVLIVDDNRAIHGDFQKILAPGKISDKGQAMEEALFGAPTDRRNPIRFELDSAYQGQEAREKVERAVAEGKPYAVAFVDIRMPPGWDGVETTARIWEVDPEIHVVICTAYSDYSWDKMGDKLWHSDKFVILKKPFDNIEALQLAIALTEKWNLARQTKMQLERLQKLVAERTTELRVAEAAVKTP
jgi:DNA-binding LytR/AlgR family response regulator